MLLGDPNRSGPRPEIEPRLVTDLHARQDGPARAEKDGAGQVLNAASAYELIEYLEEASSR